LSAELVVVESEVTLLFVVESPVLVDVDSEVTLLFVVERDAAFARIDDCCVLKLFS
jgi:hypothetical protein